MRILLTTTSYQDTPGQHHRLLEDSGHEIVRARGPLPESDMLELVVSDGGVDGILHGDDAYTRKVIEAALPRLKCLSKYGIGLDCVDLAAATELKVPVFFTPGVNHTTVAEHALGLMIMLAKHMYVEIGHVKAGNWKRITGRELSGKTLGILGLGRIGKEVAKRGKAFGMKVVAFDIHWDAAFAEPHGVERIGSAEQVAAEADILALHMSLSDDNRHFVNAERIATMKDGAIIINCARGALVNEADVAEACTSGKLGGYGADVLEHEPIETPHVFQEVENIIITPHIGSRTYESVERQAVRATRNLLNYLRGDDDYIQANEF